MSCTNNGKVETEYLGDLPIDSLESNPDYFLTERVITDPATGSQVHSITRTPTAKILPTANMDNIFTLEPNNNKLSIPENEVRAVRVVNEGSSNTMYYADSKHSAQMLAVGKLGTQILVQRCGVINIPNGHEYVVGMTYYTGNNGEPTTSSASNQPLFIPVSSTKLLIVM